MVESKLIEDCKIRSFGSENEHVSLYEYHVPTYYMKLTIPQIIYLSWKLADFSC